MALPIFKPLVLSFTAFNPSKPVTMIVRRTEDILSLAAVIFLLHLPMGTGLVLPSGTSVL